MTWRRTGSAVLVCAVIALAGAAHAQEPDEEVPTTDGDELAPASEDALTPPSEDELEAAEDVTPPPPDRAELASPPACGARAREVGMEALVRVRSGNAWGAGFVYPTPRHVVTSFGLVALGRPATVVSTTGERLAARVVARDEEFGIAVLETAEDVPGAVPLTPAPETSALVGRPVVAVGRLEGLTLGLRERGQGLLSWTMSQGQIGAVNDEGVQADLTLRPGQVGGPLLDCEGRLLAVVGSGGVGQGVTVAARTSVVDGILRDVEPSGEFIGDLRLRFGIGALLYVDDEGRVAAGGYLTVGATLFDRVSWMNRIGLLAGVSEPVEEADLSVERRVVRVESLLGWRFFVDIGGFTTLYVVPALGLSVVHESVTRRSVALEPVPGCVPSDTEACVRPRIVQASASDWRVRPALGLTFVIGPALEVAYTFELDVEEPITTFHAVHLGLSF